MKASKSHNRTKCCYQYFFSKLTWYYKRHIKWINKMICELKKLKLLIIYLIWKFKSHISLKRWMEKFFQKRTTPGFHTCILIIWEFIYLRTTLSKILVDYYVFIYYMSEGFIPSVVETFWHIKHIHNK